MNDSPENQDFEMPAPDRIDLTKPIAWNAPEGVQVQRGKLWYVFFVIVLIGLMALAILVFKNWTFRSFTTNYGCSLVCIIKQNPTSNKLRD